MAVLSMLEKYVAEKVKVSDLHGVMDGSFETHELTKSSRLCSSIVLQSLNDCQLMDVIHDAMELQHLHPPGNVLCMHSLTGR